MRISRALCETVEENDIQRLVIDGMTSYSTAIDESARRIAISSTPWWPTAKTA